MPTNEPTLQIVTNKIAKTEIATPRAAYVETPDRNPSSMDVLNQFQANMATLEDLSGRLRFMMHEIRGLIRR